MLMKTQAIRLRPINLLQNEACDSIIHYLAAYWMLTLTTGEIVGEVREGCGKGLFDM